MDNNITVICDNGGGITLQIVNATGQDYQHTYDDAGQCVSDIKGAIDGQDPVSQWDGNDLDDEDINLLDPSDDDIRNGCYRVADVTSLNDLIALANSSWHNESALAAAAQRSAP